MGLTTITDYLASIGCTFPDVDLLQPADPILDATGEDLRRRIFITQENTGTLLCLRPEFTIPVGLHCLSSGMTSGRFAYGGTVFRQRRGDATEFLQAGFEDIGNPNRQAADVETIKIALETLDACGCSNNELVVGDQSIFTTLLDALEIPTAWRKKLVRGFGNDELLSNQIAEMSKEKDENSDLFPPAISECLVTGDINQLTSVVTEMMIADGLPLVGGRTPAAIIQRIQEKAELGSTCLSKDKCEILTAFLSLNVDLKDAAHQIGEFAASHKLNLLGAEDALENLSGGLSAISGNVRYRASFGRPLDYYTGLVFEIYHDASRKPVIGGGRYDHLMSLLGASEEIPAVGFAVWVDRIGGDA